MKNNNSFDKLTASFRVFGHGADAIPIIGSLSDLHSEGVEATMMTEDNIPTPKENDKMAIFLMTDLTNDGINTTCNAAYAFLQADVLTLILTPEWEFDSACCDALSEVPIDEMHATVLALINPLIHNGPINFDFGDLRNLLRNAGVFKVLTSDGIGKERVPHAMNNLSCEFNEDTQCERLGILESCGHELKPALKAKEINAINTFIETLDAQTEVIWGMYYDDRVPADTVRITLIASGKELEL